jgi:hypothetical protein
MLTNPAETTSIEELLDAEFERIDHEMFEEDRKLLEETGRVFPAIDDILEDEHTVWAVNSAGHRYNPHPTVYFRRFSVNDKGQRIAHFSFVNAKYGVRESVKTAIIDYDLTYAPLIGTTMRITMRQEPTQWYILDPKSTGKPKVERPTYTFSDAEEAQFQKLLTP